MYTDIGQGILAGIVVDIIDLPLFVHGVRRDSGLEFISGILGSIVGGLLGRGALGVAVPHRSKNGTVGHHHGRLSFSSKLCIMAWLNLNF